MTIVTGEWRPKLLIAGGGTGGHVYPAVALADECVRRAPPWEVALVGDPRRMEGVIVPQSGHRFLVYRVDSLGSCRSLRAPLVVWSWATALPRALVLIRREAPDAVVGTGGYVSAAVVLAASTLRLPTVLLDLNAIPGRTNRRLSKRASHIALSFEEALEWFPPGRATVTGAPLRRSVLGADRTEARAELGLPPEAFVVLAFGGSQAAASINRTVLEMLPEALSRLPHLWVLHLCGPNAEAEARSRRDGIEVARRQRYVPVPYTHEMGTYLTAADLALCRAGGMTIAEICAVGLPAILVPYPHAVDNHQEANARSLESRGTARLLLDRDLSPISLLKEVEGLAGSPDELRRMRAAAQQLARPQAAQEILRLVEANLPKRAGSCTDQRTEVE